MNIIYSDKAIPNRIVKSIFLAGPSPREMSVHDWRIEAVEYLKKINFDGTIFIPVPENRFHGGSDNSSWTYTNQVNWECEARNVADIILFWIPRSISGKMPGFVTNIEFCEDLHSGKIVYGRPEDAEKCKYLDKRFQDLNLIVHNKLEDVINQAVSILGEGSLRNDGEVYVPLFIWKTEEFILKNLDKTFGNKEESEITKISIIKFSELFKYLLDFSNIGMIYVLLLKFN